MAFGQYADTQYFVTVDTGDEAKLGSFSSATGLELENMVIHFLKIGTAGGTEEFRINLHGSTESDTPIYSSDWVTLADIKTEIGTGTSDFLARVRFDFNRDSLSSGQSYFVKIEPKNYTRNNSTYYVGVALDWPTPINTQQTALKAGGGYSVIGYK